MQYSIELSVILRTNHDWLRLRLLRSFCLRSFRCLWLERDLERLRLSFLTSPFLYIFCYCSFGSCFCASFDGLSSGFVKTSIGRVSGGPSRHPGGYYLRITEACTLVAAVTSEVAQPPTDVATVSDSNHAITGVLCGDAIHPEPRSSSCGHQSLFVPGCIPTYHYFLMACRPSVPRSYSMKA